jgi:hypothetical protein
MRKRLRSHLTFANVASLVALFVVLGGGTAFAAFIITSNSQVASGTISGHHPPAGKHPNIISGSVSGKDVRDLPFLPLTLKNGWVGNCFGGGTPMIAKSAEGVVYFRGTLCQPSGSSQNAFAVPSGFQPTKKEWIAADETNTATGRLEISPNGEVLVKSDLDHVTAAQGFTSLAGVNYTLPF